MADSDLQNIDLQNPGALRKAVLARLRYERAMGVESVRPVRAAKTAPALPAPAVPLAKPAAPVPANTPKVSIAVPAPESAAPLDKETRWKKLEARALACTGCVLHRGRKTVVFGDGNRDADIMFIGEGPGADEDMQGLPFVGRAGQLLNKIIAAMKWKREDVYIANVVKCRPPDNRTPLPDEIAACQPFLQEQIELVQPKVIVTLGGPATKTLLNTTRGIMSIRGQWASYRGIPVMPTYHPAYLLRSYTEENRRAVWEDMKKVAEKLKE